MIFSKQRLYCYTQTFAHSFFGQDPLFRYKQSKKNDVWYEFSNCNIVIYKDNKCAGFFLSFNDFALDVLNFENDWIPNDQILLPANYPLYNSLVFVKHTNNRWSGDTKWQWNSNPLYITRFPSWKRIKSCSYISRM